MTFLWAHCHRPAVFILRLNNGEISSWEQSLDPPQGCVRNEAFLINGPHLSNPLGLYLLALSKSPRQLLAAFSLALTAHKPPFCSQWNKIGGNSEFQNPIQFFHVWTVVCGYRIPLSWESEALWSFYPVSVLRPVLTPHVWPSMSLPRWVLFS